mmetsp:Transcript_23220/g.64568  ORF Transcript_23220/g.64568 Transcript_23220/m.64568 type:complete len:456 (-) Transcript_23220:125-1492(-)
MFSSTNNKLASISVALLIQVIMMGILGRISAVSAWNCGGVRPFRRLATPSSFSRHQQQQHRTLVSSSSTVLQCRGGNDRNGNGNASPSSLAFSSTTRRTLASSSALGASVTDKDNAEASTQQEDEESSDNDEDSKTDADDDDDDDDLDSLRAAFEMDLPILNFGGLSFWKTTTTTDETDSKFRVLFVLGGPGAGKGTQSDLMSQNYPVVHLSAGQLLRDAAQDPDCEHRDLIQEALVGGKIVPVQISLSLLQSAMQKANNAGSGTLFLVDGFPRNQDNLSGWCQYMEGVASIWSVLFYKCPLEVLEGRILERAKNSGRSDDNLESLHKRFGTFERETMPIIHKLQRLAEPSPYWSVVDIAGDQSLDDVWEATQTTLNGLIQHDILSANADLLQSETGDEKVLDQIERAEIEFVSGKKVVVSYTRPLDKEQVRETCTWEYEGLDGWQNVSVDRTSL